MFKKYISKISNTIGTVNYLQQKTKDKPNRRSSHCKNRLFDDGYDVVDVDPATVSQMEIDLSASGSRKNSMLDEFPEHTQIILSAAIAKLRNTLFFYPLVFSYDRFYFHFHFIITLFLFHWTFIFLNCKMRTDETDTCYHCEQF